MAAIFRWQSVAKRVRPKIRHQWHSLDVVGGQKGKFARYERERSVGGKSGEVVGGVRGSPKVEANRTSKSNLRISSFLSLAYTLSFHDYGFVEQFDLA